jgi:integrase
MPPPLVLSAEQQALVATFAASLAAVGLGSGPERLWGAKAFCARVGLPADWPALTLAQQLALPKRVGTFVAWLLATGRLQASPDYLAAAPHLLGDVAAHHHPALHAAFTQTAATLGFTRGSAVRQWAAVVRVAALHQVAPDRVTAAMLEQGRALLEAAVERHRRGRQREATKALHGATATLFHLGVIDQALPKGTRAAAAARSARRQAAWSAVAPGLAATMRAYLEQMALVQRPATTTRNEAALRELGGFLARHAPEVGCVADLRRGHLEAYKAWLWARPLQRGQGKGQGTLDRASIANRLSALRVFFARLLEWGAADAPAGPLLFDGDLPTVDQRLPRFLDDGAAAKLLVAARADPDPFVRLTVELLARTGLRKGELVGLTVDAVVQIGAAYWLRVPVGKLHNDRYIPLHPQLKALLDQWLAHRPQGLRSELLFIDQGRRITTARVDAALRKTAAAAGIGHVTPHQLRHTLATQAINRGMSLEAIAALLGHRTLGMTMVYAKIADRTVADEYFKVSEKVEALYDQPHKLPADAEGSEMAKLRREMHKRMLGNGYCARPVELDCHFESICESCTFFVTTVEFRPTLERQRDDADRRGQVGRKKLFDGILARLDEEAS